MAERTLTQQELNRALLARQLLLERATLPLPRALERVGGIQAQYAPSSYIGLWSRLAKFKRDDLTRALEKRTVAQGTLMRMTIHLVSAGDYPLFIAAVREGRQAWWLKSVRSTATAATMTATAKRIRSFLKDGPRRRSEIVAALRIDSSTWNAAGLWVDLVRVPPSGTWERRSADLYETLDAWLGPSDASAEEGLDLLVRRYFAAFGPASKSDLLSWAGLTRTTIDPVLKRMKLRRFRDEKGGELLDLPGAPLPDPDTPAPPRFLPMWDATLLVQARRTQILPEKYRTRVFSTKTPHSVNTFLIDGQVAGAWRYEKGRIKIDPFHPLPRKDRAALDNEAERLAELYAAV